MCVRKTVTRTPLLTAGATKLWVHWCEVHASRLLCFSIIWKFILSALYTMAFNNPYLTMSILLKDKNILRLTWRKTFLWVNERVSHQQRSSWWYQGQWLYDCGCVQERRPRGVHKTSRQGGESEVNRRHCRCRLLTCRVGRRQTLRDGSRGQPCRKPLCCSPTSSLRNLPLCAPAFEGEVVWPSVLARLCNLRQFPLCGLYLSMQLAKDAEKVASMSWTLVPERRAQRGWFLWVVERWQSPPAGRECPSAKGQDRLGSSEMRDPHPHLAFERRHAWSV